MRAKPGQLTSGGGVVVGLVTGTVFHLVTSLGLVGRRRRGRRGRCGKGQHGGRRCRRRGRRRGGRGRGGRGRRLRGGGGLHRSTRVRRLRVGRRDPRRRERRDHRHREPADHQLLHKRPAALTNGIDDRLFGQCFRQFLSSPDVVVAVVVSRRWWHRRGRRHLGRACRRHRPSWSSRVVVVACEVVGPPPRRFEFAGSGAYADGDPPTS